MLLKDNNELRKMMMEQQSLMLENNNKVLEICKMVHTIQPLIQIHITKHLI